jgi:hypothetical protein
MRHGADDAMEYSEEYLRKLWDNEIVGDLPPFNKRNPKKVLSHIKTLVSRLKDDRHLLIETNFGIYSNVSASYVPLRISKRDKSTLTTTIQGNKRTECTKGLLLYISKLSPDWYYGGMEWTDCYRNDKLSSGHEEFLLPDSIDRLNLTPWRDPLIKIERIMTEFGYSLLDRQSLARSLWFDVNAPTIISAAPGTVFDCLFHWVD